jgi:hypothetical protein
MRNPHSLGKEKFEVGRTKSVVANPCRGSQEQFKQFTSTAIGDPYEEPGFFNKRLRSSSQVQSQATPFKTRGRSTVRSSEFTHTDNSAEPKGSHKLRPFVDRHSGFYNRKTAEPFSHMKTIGYTEDPHERRQDIERETYAKNNDKILFKHLPFQNVVKQRGTIQSNRLTFGSATKERLSYYLPKSPEAQPKYGIWKNGDKPHTGFNKTIGGHGRSTEFAYTEEMEEDAVKYQKNIRNPIWRPTHQMTKSMAMSSV